MKKLRIAVIVLALWAVAVPAVFPEADARPMTDAEMQQVSGTSFAACAALLAQVVTALDNGDWAGAAIALVMFSEYC